MDPRIYGEDSLVESAFTGLGRSILLSRMARGVRLVLLAMITRLPDDSLDSRKREDPEEGISISYLAQASGYTERHLYRLLRQIEEDDLAHRHTRLGKTSHITVAKHAILDRMRVEQDAVVQHIKEREVRNKGKKPLRDSDYEPPSVPDPVGSSEPPVEVDDGAPAWVSRRISDLLKRGYTRKDLYDVVVAADAALHGIPTTDPERVLAEERHPSLERVVLKLWRKRNLPAPDRFVEHLRIVAATGRECQNFNIMKEIRGIGVYGHRPQIGEDRAKVASYVFSPERFARMIPLAVLHTSKGRCGCRHHTAGLFDTALPTQAAAIAIPECVLNVPGDTCAFWEETLDVLDKSLGPQEAEIWLRPTHPVRLDVGVLVLEVSNRYYSDWIVDQLLPELTEALARVVGRRLEVEFVYRDAEPPPKGQA